MKPVSLTFKGINSFSDEVNIDFEKITASGIFGIFGDTGSGKSTILDCINFALYGNVDRSKINSDIINYNCEEASVNFRFTINRNGQNKLYEVCRAIRKKKNSIPKAFLYAREGSEFVCIADKTTAVNEKIHEIIGLNAEDFRKCIALPQGDFAEFVTSAPADRFKLMERLFSLQKYGDRLKEKLSKKANEAENKYREAEGGLSAYADVSESVESELKEKLSEAQTQLETATKRAGEAAGEYEKVKKAHDSKIEYENAQAKYKLLAEKKQEMDKLRAVINKLPACKTVRSISEKVKDNQKRLSLCSEKAEVCSKNFADAQEKLLRLEKSVKEDNLPELIEKLSAEVAIFSASEAKVKELNEKEKLVSRLRGQYKESLAESKDLALKYTVQSAKVKGLEDSLNKCPDYDLNAFFAGDFKNSVLREEYEKQLVYFADLRENIKIFGESDLSLYLRDIIKERIEYYKQMILSVQGESVEPLAKIKEIEASAALRDKILNEIRKEQSVLDGIDGKIKLSEANSKNIKAQGEEAAKTLQELKAALKEVFGDNDDYAAVIDLAKAKLSALKERQKNSESALNDLRQKKENLSAQRAGLNSEYETLKQALKESESTLSSALTDSGFSSVEECLAVVSATPNAEAAEKALKDYDEDCAACSAIIKKYSNNVDDFADETALDAAFKAVEATKTEVNEAHASIKVYESKILDVSARLEKKREIENKLKDIIKERDLISSLGELIRANKFLEYIACEYLSDISSVASNTLLELTDGRYYLKYTDNFYVADNFNGGELRGVNTLSGGETFLVSLSLSLALSYVLSERSGTITEFFFLDEGFGTLDGNLLDTVMNSLEKLKGKSFTIGIISHVEELRHRIENKIIVNKATESSGSSIRVILA